MSIHQALIASEEDIDIFVPSWQVGVSTGSQSLKKSLRNCDIGNLNVVKICENLSLAVNENSKYNHNVSEHIDEEDKQYKRIPFRAFSNIWFGTLKIYQHQVNTLFRLSQDLFSRSSICHAHHLQSYKRKSSVTYHKHAKKRRLTLSESNEKRYVASYSQLLDDLEKLTQEPTQNEFAEPISAPITQLQIREITIREINATTHDTPDIIDEDSGFGEASHEEIAEFFKFVEDNTINNFKKIATKRKSSSVQGSSNKKSCSTNDILSEHLNYDSAPFCENKFKSASPEGYITLEEIKTVENANGLHQGLMNINNFLQTDKIKKEDFPIMKQPVAKKRRRLIIDECIKIDILENMAEMKASDISIEGPRKTILKSYKRKRHIRAFELLKRFNRRSFKMPLSVKHKLYLSREQFEQNFLNLLREIFNSNFNIKWASEVYPKWNCVKDVVLKQSKKQRNKLREQIGFIIQTEPEVNNLDENMSTTTNEMQEILTTVNNNKETVNTCMRGDWRPYGLMCKLLNLFRLNQANKITSRTLFKLAEYQIDRALGFNSLLNLSTKQFVNLTSFPESIELQYILVGKAIKCNLTE